MGDRGAQTLAPGAELSMALAVASTTPASAPFQPDGRRRSRAPRSPAEPARSRRQNAQHDARPVGDRASALGAPGDVQRCLPTAITSVEWI